MPRKFHKKSISYVRISRQNIESNPWVTKGIMKSILIKKQRYKLKKLNPNDIYIYKIYKHKDLEMMRNIIENQKLNIIRQTVRGRF